MYVLLLAAALSTAPATPIRDSVDRLTAGTASDSQAGGVTGFEREGVRKPKREKFFGATNVLMGVGILGSAVADVETTLTCIGTTGQTVTPFVGGYTIETRSCAESKRFMRPLIAEGRWAAYGGKAAVDVPVWVSSHFMRRSRNKFLKVAGYALPIMATGIQMKFAADNIRETHWVRTGRR